MPPKPKRYNALNAINRDIGNNIALNRQYAPFAWNLPIAKKKNCLINQSNARARCGNCKSPYPAFYRRMCGAAAKIIKKAKTAFINRP